MQAIAAIGENAGCMTLKGASPDYDGPAAADRWELDESCSRSPARWGIDPQRDLRGPAAVAANRRMNGRQR